MAHAGGVRPAAFQIATALLACAWVPGELSARDAARVATAEVRIGLPVTIGDVTSAEGDTGVTVFAFPVTVFNPVPEDATFSFTTVDGTARVDDGDYEATNHDVRAPFGTTQTFVPVRVRGDTRVEPDEFFTLELLPASPDQPSAAAAGTSGTGTIQSDDVETTVLVSGFSCRRMAAAVELRWVQSRSIGVDVQRSTGSEARWTSPKVSRYLENHETRANDETVQPGLGYRYRLADKDGLVLAGPISVAPADGGLDLALIVSPNPALASLRARITTPRILSARLDLLDATSRVVAILFKGVLAPGAHEIVWRDRNRMAAGVYVVRLRANGVALTRKVAITP